MLPTNIRVDMNCQPTWVTQNAIPDVQELNSLGGGPLWPPPCKVGLILVKQEKFMNYAKEVSV